MALELWNEGKCRDLAEPEPPHLENKAKCSIFILALFGFVLALQTQFKPIISLSLFTDIPY